MTDRTEKSGTTRRQWLAGTGAMGLMAFSGRPETAHASVPRITAEDFGYGYRTFKPDKTIRVAMIGTDGHTNTVLEPLPGLANVELVAFAHKTNRDLALPDGVKEYDDYIRMLDTEQPDVVGVCMPYSLNAAASMAAADRGAHIISEKPVATTLHDLNALLETVKRTRVRMTAMLSMRMEPRFQAIRREINAGTIGEPILATAQKSYKFGESRPDFYRDAERYGGTIPWVGIHAIDFIHYVTGLDFSRVTAFQGNKDHPEYPGFQDHAGVLLEMENNGTAMVNIDYLRPETAGTWGDDRLRVIGSEGVLEIKDGGERVECITQTSGPVDIPLHEHRPFFADFITELRGGKPHIVAPEEPFEMSRAAILAHEAARESRIISL